MNDRLTELPLPSALLARASMLAWQYCRQGSNATGSQRWSAQQADLAKPTWQARHSHQHTCCAAAAAPVTVSRQRVAVAKPLRPAVQEP